MLLRTLAANPLELGRKERHVVFVASSFGLGSAPTSARSPVDYLDCVRVVIDERLVRFGVAFARQTVADRSGRLCQACVDVLQVSGAGITIMSGNNTGPVCSSDERVGRLEDLQFALGQGPCHDAFTTGRRVDEPDLALREPSSWPLYSTRAFELGARAVFAVPLRLDATPIGVLTIYHDDTGQLTDEQIGDSEVLAVVIAKTISWIHLSSLPTTDTQRALAGELTDIKAHRAEVHQASGMTAVQLEIGVVEALLRLRAYAYANNESVAFVAQEIVAHRLRLGDDRAEPDTRTDS
jgi:GAF domain-containing protein